jgi:hypothetical protein
MLLRIMRSPTLLFTSRCTSVEKLWEKLGQSRLGWNILHPRRSRARCPHRRRASSTPRSPLGPDAEDKAAMWWARSTVPHRPAGPTPRPPPFPPSSRTTRARRRADHHRPANRVTVVPCPAHAAMPCHTATCHLVDSHTTLTSVSRL